MHSIIYAKVDVEKVCTFIRKCSLNDAKARSKINDQSMKIRNLRFLVFCGEYNVKIVFYMIRGIRNQAKVDEHQCKIDARKKNVKIMKNMLKENRNGSQNHDNMHKNEGSKIHRIYGYILGGPWAPGRCPGPAGAPAGAPARASRGNLGGSLLVLFKHTG